MLCRSFSLLVMLSVLCPIVSAGEPQHDFRFWERYSLNFDRPGSQLKDHIYARSLEAFARGDAQRAQIKTPEALRERQTNLRRDFLEAIGGLPESDTPLNAVTTGTVEADGFRIENVVFESRPRHYVTANLYVPNGVDAPTGAVLFLMGHSWNGRLADHYQAVAQSLARAGLVVLAMDPIGQGERLGYVDPQTGKPSVAPGTREHDYVGVQVQLAGDGLARYFLHDAMRGLDYLSSRPEVDPQRIGVTGTSGGGTQTMMMMAADPRIAAAAPSSAIMSRESFLRTGKAQDAEQHFYDFSRKGYDHADFLLAMAPRPVCVLGAAYDYFPIEGARHSVAQAQPFWEMLGHPGGLQLVQTQTRHGYAPAHVHAAARFFSRVLLGREVGVEDFTPVPYPPEAIYSTGSGQVALDFKDAEFVFDVNLERLHSLAAARGQFNKEAFHARAAEWIRQKVFQDRIETELNPRVGISGMDAGDYLTDMVFWWSQPHLINMGVLIRAKDDAAATVTAGGATSASAQTAVAATGTANLRGVTIALWEGGIHAVGEHLDWLARECAQGRAVLVLNLSGMGPLSPDAISDYPMKDFYGTFQKFADDLYWLGDSLVALRTFELIRSLEALPKFEGVNPEDVRIYAYGRMGVHGKLAAAIEPRIGSIEWEEPFTFSELAGARFYPADGIKEFVLPGVLEIFDLDEI